MKKFTLEEPRNLGARALGVLVDPYRKLQIARTFIHNTFLTNSQKKPPRKVRSRGLACGFDTRTSIRLGSPTLASANQQLHRGAATAHAANARAATAHAATGGPGDYRILGNSARRGNFRAAGGVEKLELPARGNPHRHDSPFGGLLAPGTTIGAPRSC